MENINIDKNIYNQESLSLLNIRDLRDIGRTFGVPSPTTKSKDELIDYILKILYGEIKGESRSTRGRPNNRTFNQEKYLNEIKKRSIVRPDAFMYPESDAEFSLKVASPKSMHVQENEVKQRVFIKEDDALYLRVHGFIESAEDLTISKAIEEKYHLENFDIVEIVEAGGLFNIVSVNGKSVKDKFEDFRCLGHTFKNGGKQVFHFSTKEEIKTEISNIEKSCKEKDARLAVFSAGDYIADADTLVKVCEADVSEVIYKKLIQFTSFIEKSIYDGESVVAVMTDTELIERAVDSFDEQVSSRIKKHLQDKQEAFAKLGNVLLIFKLDEEDVTY